MRITKVTHGWVTQTFDVEGDEVTFVEQEFCAGDLVNVENEMGDEVQIDLPYQSFDMVQPDEMI